MHLLQQQTLGSTNTSTGAQATETGTQQWNSKASENEAAVYLEFGFAFFFVLWVVWHRKAAASASRLLVGIQVCTAKHTLCVFAFVCACTPMCMRVDSLGPRGGS